MKKFLLFAGVFVSNLVFCIESAADNCKRVYTIGAYDEAFSKQAIVTKLGPIPTPEVPTTIPKSFLEKEGSYGGGEAFCSIHQACHALKKQLTSGILSENENWHIYLLDAAWDEDVYELHSDDFRIKHPVRVLKLVKENCWF